MGYYGYATEAITLITVYQGQYHLEVLLREVAMKQFKSAFGFTRF